MSETTDPESSFPFRDVEPSDFEIIYPNPHFVRPCYVNLSLTLRPNSESAKRLSLLPWSIPIQIDLFSRLSRTQQLHQRISFLAEDVPCAWGEFLWKLYLYQLEPLVQDLLVLLPKPLVVPTRDAFSDVSLERILKENPGNTEVYVAVDKGAYGHPEEFLRIHTLVGPPLASRLWFEKRIRQMLREVDMVPWFISLINSLPKKRRPENISAWVERLFFRHPEFRLAENVSTKQWRERHPIVLVFGDAKNIGSSALFHLDRDRIRGIRREGSELKIEATIPNPYQEDPQKLWWTFYLFTPSSFHAARLESRLIAGDVVHFGIGDDIHGMVAVHDTSINAIGVPYEDLERFCPPEMKPHLASPKHQRHKLYYLVPLSFESSQES
jgi:hypothetical protein